jgi:hypothetical protein
LAVQRNTIGQFPPSGGTAASAVQYDTQSVSSLHQAAQPLWLYNEIQSVNSLRLPTRRRGLSVVRPSRAGHEFLRNSYRRIPHIQQTPSSASHEFLRNPWSCGFAARCAVRLGLTGGDPSTSIGLRPKMAGAARTKRAGASWKVEDFSHIRRHSRFGWTTQNEELADQRQRELEGHSPIGCTARHPIGQFPPSGGTAASAVQRNPIGQFPEGTDAQARPLGRAAEPASHEFLRDSYRRIPHIQQTPSSASHEVLRDPGLAALPPDVR